MKKTLTSIVLILSLVLSLFVTASANEDITIYVNDETLICDTAPFIKDGRTMVPMRKIFEALNAKVDWDGTTQTITATKDNAQIVLQINNSTMYNNGVAETLDVAPIIVNSSTFVPIRAVSQSLNASVDWFGHTQTVYINSTKTYNEEYNSYIDFFMQGSVFAGYEWVENVGNNATVHSDICAQGSISDVQVNGNDIYLIMNNRYSQGEKIAIYIADTESTSLEKMTEIFKNTNISVGGSYLGVTTVFGIPTISMQYVSIFESDSWYEISELTYPKLSLFGQTVTLYNWDNQPLDVPITQVDDYLEVGWTTEMQTTLYAPDGRTIVVEQDEIYDYINAGWYRSYAEAQTANAPSYSDDNYYSYDSDYDNQPNSGGDAVYRTPSGKKYHFDPNCGGKNSYQITLQQAKNSGLTPCDKCAW
ncbi:MAG: copper amine oxidase N-terminal domain-containing protein [Ruminococcaceae bacterium]|nr:copper amine oxidase N-terminal domain-containing protein [Oscillospiraceae bacterium]